MHLKRLSFILLSYFVGCQFAQKVTDAQEIGAEEEIDDDSHSYDKFEKVENEEIEEFFPEKNSFNQPAPMMMPLVMPSVPTAVPPPPPPNIIMMPAPPPPPQMRLFKRKRIPLSRSSRKKPKGRSKPPGPPVPQPVTPSTTSIVTVTASANIKTFSLPTIIDVEGKFLNGTYLPSFMNGTVLSGTYFPALSLTTTLKALQSLSSQPQSQNPFERMHKSARSLMRFMAPIRARFLARQAIAQERRAKLTVLQNNKQLKRQKIFDSQKSAIAIQSCQREILQSIPGCKAPQDPRPFNTASPLVPSSPTFSQKDHAYRATFAPSLPDNSSGSTLSNSTGIKISNSEFDNEEGQDPSDLAVLNAASIEVQAAAELLYGPLQNFLNVLSGLSGTSAEDLYFPFLSELQFEEDGVQLDSDIESCLGPVFLPMTVPIGFNGLQNSLLFKPKHANDTQFGYGLPLDLFPNGAIVLPLNKTSSTLECALAKSILASPNSLFNATVNGKYISLPIESSRFFETIASPVQDLRRGKRLFDAFAFNASSNISSCIADLNSFVPENPKNLPSNAPLSPASPDLYHPEPDSCPGHRTISEYLSTLSL
jgi:hypothetical protein